MNVFCRPDRGPPPLNQFFRKVFLSKQPSKRPMRPGKTYRQHHKRRLDMYRLIIMFLGVGLIHTTLVTPASAQRNTYEKRYDSSKKYNRRKKNYRNNKHVAGKFDYYSLVLSWSPTHCATVRTKGHDLQCNPRDGRRYSFVLHGLWPQYNKGYPNNCRIGKRPFVPNNIIDFMLDIMPSRRLVIHEYKKHGTCSGLSPKGYYALSRKLYRSIQIPDRYVNPEKNQFVSPSQLSQEFMNLNPQLRADMFAISCGGPGNRLREIRICFNRKGEPTPCGRNENQRRLCSAKRMFVPPVRPSQLKSKTDRRQPASRDL